MGFDHPTPGLRIGVDLGGTKIEALALAPGGRELARIRVPTPKNYEETLEALASLVQQVERAAGKHGTVGIGIPGSLSPTTGLVRNANSVWLIGHALDADLAKRLERPVRIMNDANCFALSEAIDGAGRGEKLVFGVILGTGVGGGIVLDGRPVRGKQLIAGEWGHNPLPWPRDHERPGAACYCGKRGCIETFLSGPSFARDHRAATGRDWIPRNIGEEVHRDAGAADAYARYVERLGRSLALVVNVLDPDVIVLGGGLSNLPRLAADTQAALAPWVFTDEVRTRVVGNIHGDSSGVRGAAWLWANEDPI